MERIRRMLLENRAWAKGHLEADPEYFKKMSLDQKPEMLWIGCADSRVPPDEIFNTRPGTIFVHRNIANLVYQEDSNLMSVVEYAVGFLNVKYVAVCGHYGCGGVKAAYDGIENPLIAKWIRSVRDLRLQKSPATVDELVELSVRYQIEELSKIPVIQKVWSQGVDLKLLGWVYDLRSGMIKEITIKTRDQQMNELPPG